MTDQELRLECLRLAVSNTKSSDAGELVNSAEKLYSFVVIGKSDEAEVARKLANIVLGRNG